MHLKMPSTGAENLARVRRDLKILATFIRIYFRDRHGDRQRSVLSLRTRALTEIAGWPAELCRECGKLLAHASVKRSGCPMNPKPARRHCPRCCYHPAYRHQIRQVMRYSGRKLVMRGRLDLLFHLLF